MWMPLAVLAVLSFAGGFVGVPPALSSLVGVHAPNHFEHFLEPAVAHVAAAHGEAARVPTGVSVVYPTGQSFSGVPAEEHHDVGTERLFTVISVVVALLGIGLGWLLFTRQPVRPMPTLLENKYYVDEIYDGAIINPIEQGSRHILWQVVDVRIIDGVVNGVAQLFASLAGTLRLLQTGFARGYAAMILAGAIVVIGYFAWR